VNSDNSRTTAKQTGDNLRERVEAIVYQARAQRAADLGVLIGTGLALFWRALVGTLSLVSHPMRAVHVSRVGRLPPQD